MDTRARNGSKATPFSAGGALAAAEPSRARIDAALRSVLRDVLGLDEQRAAALDPSSGLFGHLPELDSMAVAGLLTELEDRLDIVIEDDEVDTEMLETYGALLTYAEAKAAGS